MSSSLAKSFCAVNNISYTYLLVLNEGYPVTDSQIEDISDAWLNHYTDTHIKNALRADRAGKNFWAHLVK
jgi:hypothetical protein